MTNTRIRLAALTATALFALSGVGAGSAFATEIPPGDTPDPVETTDLIVRPADGFADVVTPPIETADVVALPGDGFADVVAPPVDTTGVVAQPGDQVAQPDPPAQDQPASGGTSALCPGGDPGITVRAKQTTITAPPSGGSQQVLEFLGDGFRPNTTLKISLRNYPAADGSQVDLELEATTDEQGNLHWSVDLSQLPRRNFGGDTEVDVWITVTDGKGCAAMTPIKAGTIISPPLS